MCTAVCVQSRGWPMPTVAAWMSTRSLSEVKGQSLSERQILLDYIHKKVTVASLNIFVYTKKFFFLELDSHVVYAVAAGTRWVTDRNLQLILWQPQDLNRTDTKAFWGTVAVPRLCSCQFDQAAFFSFNVKLIFLYHYESFRTFN